MVEYQILRAGILIAGIWQHVIHLLLRIEVSPKTEPITNCLATFHRIPDLLVTLSTTPPKRHDMNVFGLNNTHL